MSIITISRGSYSYGKEIAENLAEKLKYGCISREILLEASSEFHIPEMKLVHAVHDSPTIFDRFTHGKEKYITYIRYALLKHMQEDNIIYHGLAGQFFLHDIDHVLKVRIIADLDKRIEIVMNRDNVNAEKALNILTRDDKARHKWSHSLYGIDTTDSSLYDIIIHVSKLTVDDAVNIIANAIQQPAFKTTEKSQKKLDDLVLAVHIEAALIDDFLPASVSVEDGHVKVSLKGDIKEIQKITEDVKKRISNMADVQSVEVDVQPILMDVRF